MQRYALHLLIGIFSFAFVGVAKAQPAHILYEQFEKELTAGKIQQALKKADQSIAAITKQTASSPDSLYDYVVRVAYQLYSSQYIEQSIPYYIKSLPLKRKLSGEDDPDYQELLKSIAHTCLALRQFNTAEPLYKEILDYRRNKYGTSDSLYIDALSLYANNRLYQGSSEEAIALYREAKKWYDERTIRTADYVRTIAWLGNSLFEIAAYRESELQFIEAKNLQASINANDPMYYEILHFLALIYIKLGLNTKATDYYDILLTYYKSTQGNELNYASVLSEMAGVHRLAGKYAQAEELLKESLEVRKQQNGLPDLIANSYNELANLYLDLGNQDKAEHAFRQALELREKHYGKDHVYATYLHNLAIIYTDDGDFAKALPLEMEGARILEKYNRKDPNYMQSLANIAYHLLYLGRKKEARLYLDTAMKLSKDIIADHPHLYELYMMAGIYSADEQKYAEAVSWYEKANALHQKLYGTGNTEAAAMNRLAHLHIKTGNYSEAFRWQTEKNTILRKKIVSGISFLTEAEMVNLSNSSNFADIPALIAHHSDDVPGATAMLYDNLLFIKGLALNNNTAITKSIHRSGDTALIRLWNENNDLERIIYELEQLEASRRPYNIDSLRQLAENNEKLLVKRSQSSTEKNDFLHASWKTVQQQLDDKSCAIEFVRYRTGHTRQDSAFYGAVIIRKGMNAPVFVKLCSEKKLLNLLGKYQANSGDLYLRSLSIKGAKTIKPSKELFDLVWKPLQQHLSGIQHISFSPDGLLHRVSFAALPVNDSLLLIQQFSLSQLFSTRHVNTTTAEHKPSGIMLVGGIDFNHADATSSTGNVDDFSFVLSNRSSDMNEFKALPGTLLEINNLSAIAAKHNIPAKAISGKAATETAFRTFTANPPDVIHISTHGFSLPDEQTSINNSFGAASDPLVRCGLVMAGGNVSWKEKRAGNAADGILTGKEISMLNLSSCRLAVLSACETGLGNIKGSEGVFGLQRALKTAGVQSVIVSLWAVPDKETVEFMELFYGEWFRSGDKDAAFRSAQLQMLQKYTPGIWAAFVLIR